MSAFTLGSDMCVRATTFNENFIEMHIYVQLGRLRPKLLRSPHEFFKLYLRSRFWAPSPKPAAIKCFFKVKPVELQPIMGLGLAVKDECRPFVYSQVFNRLKIHDKGLNE